MPNITKIKFPFLMQYCSLNRAVTFLNESKHIKSKVYFEDFIYWEKHAFFKPLIPIDSINRLEKINISITKKDTDEDTYVLDDDFLEYAEKVRMKSLRAEGFRLGNIDIFEVSPLKVSHRNSEINILSSCYIRGYLHSNSYILNSLPQFVPDFNVEVEHAYASTIITVNFDYFRSTDNPDTDLEIFKSDWLNKVMICEQQINRLHERLIALQDHVTDNIDELQIKHKKPHGNTLKNKEIDNDIVNFAQCLIKDYPDKCKNISKIAKLIDEKSMLKWPNLEGPPRTFKHITSLLSRNNILKSE